MYNDTFLNSPQRAILKGSIKFISKVFYDNAIHGKSKLRVFGRPLDGAR